MKTPMFRSLHLPRCCGEWDRSLPEVWPHRPGRRGFPVTLRCSRCRLAAGGNGQYGYLPVAGFYPAAAAEGRGLTPRGRTFRCALWIFTLAAIAALLSSGWNNRQLLQRVSFDIARYDRIPMHDFGPKADAVAVLRDDAAQLDDWARGVPAGWASVCIRGASANACAGCDPLLGAPPPPPEPQPKPKPVPKIVRLDSMSLFDSGKSVLKAGSTKMLVNSLVGIKAKPGWLIVVAGIPITPALRN
jgi:outer membrane protein OmpA-like peptidoglycan-associated protein